MSPATVSAAGHIWDVLSRIDVNEHTEKKGKLTYLSWAWAWQELMARFPDTTYEFTDRQFPDGTVEVTCNMVITTAGEAVPRMMWLPVMDNRNNPIKNPNAFQINTAKMRCLTKCISMYGLGAYIYAGEDLPTGAAGVEPAPIEQDLVTDEQIQLLVDALEYTGRSQDKMLKYYGIKGLSEMTVPMFEQAYHGLQNEIARQAQMENTDVKAGLS